MIDSAKKKVVYIRTNINHLKDNVKLPCFTYRELILTYHFDVTLIEKEKIEASLILSYNPEMVIVNSHPSIMSVPKLLNHDLLSHIPVVGLITFDDFEPYRYSLIDLYKKNGINQYFSIGFQLGSYYTSIRNSNIVMPWAIDSSIMKDYDIEKDVDILLTGHNKLTYPWRNYLFPLLKQCFNTATISYPKGTKSTTGEAFYKQLNRAKLIPTCGGFPKTFVYKLIEIPASNACLVTEKTETVEEIGFVDMENAIFVDESNYKEKLDKVLKDEALLKKITNNGYDLVQKRHSYKNRTQLSEWLILYQQKSKNQKIVQKSLFAPLELADIDEEVDNFIISDSYDKPYLDSSVKDIINKNYNDAIEKMQYCSSNFIFYSPDYKIRLSLAYFLQGDIQKASEEIFFLFSQVLSTNKYFRPDPIEWSMLLLCLTKTAGFKTANRIADSFIYKEDEFYCHVRHFIFKHTNPNSSSVWLDLIQKNNFEFTSSHGFFLSNKKELLSILVSNSRIFENYDGSTSKTLDTESVSHSSRLKRFILLINILYQLKLVKIFKPVSKSLLHSYYKIVKYPFNRR